MNLKRTILIWAVLFLGFLLFTNYLTRSKNPPELAGEGLAVVTSKKEYDVGDEVIIRIKNNTGSKITLPLSCPKNPFRVTKFVGNEFEAIEAESKILCKGPQEIILEAGKEIPVSYTYWTYALFSETGRYKIEIPLASGEIFFSNEFTIEPRGLWGQFTHNIIYRPILNALVFLVSVLPGNSLGLAIILLTLLIRIVLLIPSQRALQSQKRMQELQPKLEAIRKKYEGNKERIAQETMALWKQEKVNPMGSCLPILIQLPILIAFYYVIQNGINPDNAQILYGSLKNFDFTKIGTNFLNILELTSVNAFVLPVVVGLLQYLQMKMAIAKPKLPAGEKGSEMQMANTMMVYVMPVMIALFTASVPAGVGLYWGVSTVFGIGQQFYVNRLYHVSRVQKE